MGEDEKNDQLNGENNTSSGSTDPNAGQDKGNQGNNNANVPSGNNDGKQDRTFTQEEVNRMMAKEKRQGKSSVYNELGIDPNDAESVELVKAILASRKKMSEGEAAAASNAELDQAKQRAIVAEAKAEAMMMGIQPKYVDDAVALALPKLTDDADLKTIVGELKQKYPIWAAASDDDDSSDGKNNANVGKKGTGSSISTGDKSQNNNDGAKGIGARLAASRRANKPKSSYWGKN